VTTVGYRHEDRATQQTNNSEGRPVVRYFPRVRRSAVSALVAVCSVLTVVAVPLASADELEDRRERVQGDIQQAHRHLDQSSEELVRATRALSKAQRKLNVARTRLSRTRGELAAAAAFDERMQRDLAAAITRLHEARADLEEGRAEVVRQEELLGQIAVQNYQSGDPSLLGLSMVLTTQDPAQLTSQLNSVRNVLDKESVSLDRLRATRVMLAVQEKQVERARDAVAVKRREAAANLERKSELEAEAEQVKAQVATLVTGREKARGAAARAQAEDLRRLDQLERERGRISAMLKARAERARARAAAAAAASRSQTHRAGGFLGYPVAGSITSEYGMRLHPIYKRYTLHDGTDFGAACGTPIRAATSGEVISMSFNEGYGNRVVIDHGFRRGVGLGTAYNHLSRYSTFVGERVSRGEVIGYVGSTGYSTGCHLHFMVFENGTTVDPMGWL